MDQPQPQADSSQTGGLPSSTTSSNTIHPPDKENLLISTHTGATPQSRH